MNSDPPPEDLPDHVDSKGAAGSEPVMLAHVISTVLYALVGAGFVVLSDQRIAWIAAVGAFVLSTGAALAARARVTPTGRVTWPGIREAIQEMVWEEVDRLAAAAPTMIAVPAPSPAPADEPADGPAPEPAPEPAPVRPLPSYTAPEPLLGGRHARRGGTR